KRTSWVLGEKRSTACSPKWTTTREGGVAGEKELARGLARWLQPAERGQDAVLGNRRLGSEGLREQADPELFEHPAHVGHVGPGAPAGRQGGHRVAVRLLRPLADGHAARVPARVLRQLVEPALHAPQVAG